MLGGLSHTAAVVIDNTGTPPTPAQKYHHPAANQPFGKRDMVNAAQPPCLSCEIQRALKKNASGTFLMLNGGGDGIRVSAKKVESAKSHCQGSTLSHSYSVNKELSRQIIRFYHSQKKISMFVEQTPPPESCCSYPSQNLCLPISREKVLPMLIISSELKLSTLAEVFVQ